MIIFESGIIGLLKSAENANRRTWNTMVTDRTKWLQKNLEKKWLQKNLDMWMQKNLEQNRYRRT